MGRLARGWLFWAAGARVLALAVYLAFGLFGVQAAFTNNQVNEEFDPGSAASAQGDPEPTAEPEGTEPAPEAAAETPAADEKPAPDEASSSEEEPATEEGTQEKASEGAGSGGREAEEAPEPAPQPAPEPEPAGPVVISSGAFHPVDHQGSGRAVVYRLEDGSHVLRLEDLNVENGPDLYVYAIAASDAYDEAAALEAGFVNLGRLKGNVGNQTYELPAEYDPEVHRAISVWCQRFTSNFATAPLTS